MHRYLIPGMLSLAFAAAFFALSGMRYQDYIAEITYWQEHPCLPESLCRIDISRFILQDTTTYIAVGAVLASIGAALMVINYRHKSAAAAKTIE